MGDRRFADFHRGYYRSFWQWSLHLDLLETAGSPHFSQPPSHLGYLWHGKRLITAFWPLQKKGLEKNLSLLHISKIMPRMHCFTYLVQTQLMTFRIVCSTHRFITFPSKVLKIIILTFVPDLCGVLHPSIFLSEILAFLRSIGPNTNPTLRHTHSPNWVDGECVLHSGFGYRTVFGRLLSLFASKVSYQHQNACTMHLIPKV